MKPVEKEAIILRESTETIVADKYRCLLFLLKEDYSGNCLRKYRKFERINSRINAEMQKAEGGGD